LAKVPATKVAVKPVTPVEFTVWPICPPPFPPVYGIELLAPEAATPLLNVPMLVALVQDKELILPGGVTTRVSVQVRPPMFSAKLAVPLEVGVPVII
jgi:hypothetical protein